MPRKNRFGKRMIPKDLEVNRGITIKKINVALKDYGYQLRFTGYEPEYEFPTYAVYTISPLSPAILHNAWRVYAIGDYTVQQWCRQVVQRLRRDSADDATRIVRRATRKRYRRKKRSAAIAKAIKKGKTVV